jgi:hypothetical protein
MCERLCVKACNAYLNLNYACFLCHDILYLIHVNFMQICIFECMKYNDECFLINMLSLEKSEVTILLVLPGKTGWSDFGRLSICFSNLICCDSSVMCIT